MLVMSACGYKRTFQGVSQNVRFTPESGHALDTRLPEAHPPLSVPDLAAVKHTPVPMGAHLQRSNTLV